jgi:hypothetical protein
MPTQYCSATARKSRKRRPPEGAAEFHVEVERSNPTTQLRNCEFTPLTNAVTKKWQNQEPIFVFFVA